ncbi:MAG: hypothetical protein QNJ78_07660 [Gammaproteobacteria bacterium]|nr:hypothetical protein [Gammaproteobacteria bacterium]
MTGSLVLLKLAVMAIALILLAKAMLHVSHPGSMDPDLADVTLHRQLPHIHQA